MRLRCEQQIVDTDSARRFAENCNVAIVTAKLCNVGLDPLKRRDLIHQSEVAQKALRIFPRKCGVREPSGATESIIYGYDDDALLRELRAVVRGTGPKNKSAAVNPHHHR